MPLLSRLSEKISQNKLMPVLTTQGRRFLHIANLSSHAPRSFPCGAPRPSSVATSSTTPSSDLPCPSRPPHWRPPYRADPRPQPGPHLPREARPTTTVAFGHVDSGGGGEREDNGGERDLDGGDEEGAEGIADKGSEGKADGDQQKLHSLLRARKDLAKQTHAASYNRNSSLPPHRQALLPRPPKSFPYGATHPSSIAASNTTTSSALPCCPSIALPSLQVTASSSGSMASTRPHSPQGARPATAVAFGHVDAGRGGKREDNDGERDLDGGDDEGTEGVADGGSEGEAEGDPEKLHFLLGFRKDLTKQTHATSHNPGSSLRLHRQALLPRPLDPSPVELPVPPPLPPPTPPHRPPCPAAPRPPRPPRR